MTKKLSLNKKTHNILSIGWGVQSWTLCNMVVDNYLYERLGLHIDLAIHSDTTFEHRDTYDFINKHQQNIINRGLPIISVKAESNNINNNQNVIIPAYTTDKNGTTAGLLKRQCTGRWKIEPIRSYLSKYLKNYKLRKHKDAVIVHLGISYDEALRMKDSDVLWIKNNYPLVDLKFTRDDCIKYLTDRGLPVPRKSSCVFCPYKNKNEWSYMFNNYNNDSNSREDLIEAIKMDELIRNRRENYISYIHNSRKPLSEIINYNDHNINVVNTSSMNVMNSSNLNEECDSGYCFV